MNRLSHLFIAFLTLFLCTHVESAERLSLLFLGDSGHHQPRERSKQLIPVLSERGIDVEYSDRIEDLNSEKLRLYDGLIIYANWGTISSTQERALLDFVASGKGFIPLHCASYCFLNSPEYVALVGAQFQRHGTGVFRTDDLEADHPILQGLDGFETWDETYVHTKHNDAERTILQTRREGTSNEPWTWVRTHGKGRVFYTAYGHDHRTFANPGFHGLVERGIRWACGDDTSVPVRLKPVAEGAAPFRYQDAKLPNYLPGRSWGTQGEPFGRMQLPVAPAESMKHMVTPAGFRVERFASDPDISKPLNMAWDHRGRLWIAETRDYPNELKPEREGRDKIKICEDTNGDGRADKFTIFADQLSIPTSMLFYDGGVIVQQAPHTLFLKDTDGDDRADVRKILFSGWSTGDTHAGPSNLRWGFDNWVWGICGYSGFRGEVGGERHEFRTGFFRFKPDGSKLEFVRNTNNNSWGVGFSEEGILFGSTANGNPSVYMPIANRYYERVRGWSSRRLENTAIGAEFYPITNRVRQVDWHGKFTAAAGHALYTARSYPQSYWNRAAFVNGPTGHLVATFLIEPKGSDFVSRNSWNLFASVDEWTAPIMSEVGPDGSVWMIDWYNYIVQHNPTPRGYKTGKGNAYETPLRDKVHGRIYRIVHERADRDGASARTKLNPANAADLVAALSEDNLFWRIHAQRLLIERKMRDVVPALIELTRDESVDAIGLNPAAIHALWTLHGLGALDGSDSDANAAAVAAIRHPSAGVRRAAVLVASRSKSVGTVVNALSDDNAQVRLAAFLTLSDVSTSEFVASNVIGASILESLVKEENSTDRWIPHAATSAAAKHDRGFLDAASRLTKMPGDAVAEVLTRVGEHWARGKPNSANTIVTALATAEPGVARAIVEGLARGWPRDHKPDLDAAGEDAVARVLQRLPSAAKSTWLKVASNWGVARLDRFVAEVADNLLATALDEKSTSAERVDAARQLVEFKKNDGSTVDALLESLGPRVAPELATGLLDAIGTSEADSAGTSIVDALSSMPPESQTTRTVAAGSAQRVGQRTPRGNRERRRRLRASVARPETRTPETSRSQGRRNRKGRTRAQRFAPRPGSPKSHRQPPSHHERTRRRRSG